MTTTTEHRPDPRTVQALAPDGAGLLIIAMCVCGGEDCGYSELVTTMSGSLTGTRARLEA